MILSRCSSRRRHNLSSSLNQKPAQEETRESIWQQAPQWRETEKTSAELQDGGGDFATFRDSSDTHEPELSTNASAKSNTTTDCRVDTPFFSIRSGRHEPTKCTSNGMQKCDKDSDAHHCTSESNGTHLPSFCSRAERPRSRALSIAKLVTGLNIMPCVEFFTKSSDPTAMFDERECRDAYTLHDDYLKGKYIFPWKIGEKGRLVLTLDTPESCQIPMRVQRVLMGISGNHFQELKFFQEKESEISPKIIASLDASIFKASTQKLETPCPYWGDVDTRYVPLNIIIVISIGEKAEYAEAFTKTIYTRIRPSERTRKSFLYQASRKKDEALQQIRSVLSFFTSTTKSDQQQTPQTVPQ